MAAMSMFGSMHDTSKDIAHQQQQLTQHPVATVALVIHGLLLPVEQFHQTDLASWTTIAGSTFGHEAKSVRLLPARSIRIIRTY